MEAFARRSNAQGQGVFRSQEPCILPQQTDPHETVMELANGPVRLWPPDHPYSRKGKRSRRCLEPTTRLSNIVERPYYLPHTRIWWISRTRREIYKRGFPNHRGSRWRRKPKRTFCSGRASSGMGNNRHYRNQGRNSLVPRPKIPS